MPGRFFETGPGQQPKEIKGKKEGEIKRNPALEQYLSILREKPYIIKLAEKKGKTVDEVIFEIYDRAQKRKK